MKFYLERIFFSLIFSLFPRNTESVKDGTGIVSLICRKHLNMFIFSMTSFFYFTKRSYPLYVVDDFTLSDRDKQKLHSLFDITIVSSHDSTEAMRKFIDKKKYPHFYEYRFQQKNTFSKVKFDALFLCPFERVICLDSDVLFFAPPKRLLKWLDKKEKISLYNYHNWTKTDEAQIGDLEHAFRELARRYWKGKFNFVSTFNAGLFCLPNKAVLDLKKLDTLFTLFNEVTYSRFSIVDETALGCILSHPKVGEALNSEEYVVCPNIYDYPVQKTNKIQAIHYAGESKPFFFKDALRVANATNFFRSKMVRSVSS